MKFKAHINRKGKPLDEKVDVALVSYYSPSIDTTLVSLAPYRPGMYEWEFRLSDSLRLRLDKDYTLRFRTGDKRANDVTGRFRYEEYELGKLTFTARADKQKYARGDTVRISLSAADENNMPVYDGRVKVLVKPARYMGLQIPRPHGIRPRPALGAYVRHGGQVHEGNHPARLDIRRRRVDVLRRRLLILRCGQRTQG